jgi:hypothetical protein
VGGVLRHIRATVACREARKLQIKSYHVNVLDLEDEPDADDTPSNASDASGDDTNLNVDFDPSPFLEPTPEPLPPPSAPESRRARVDDVDDDNDNLTGSTRYVNPYPHLAGAAKSKANPKFECIHKERGGDVWAPFGDQDEWELARWLAQNVGQKQTDDFLKLPIVSDHHTLGSSLPNWRTCRYRSERRHHTTINARFFRK